jgi:peptide/nickel transport system ATP-binding protein
MKQRTVMVLSTLLNPALLIADEITSALDVSTQRAVAETLIEFRDRGYVKSVMVITHDLSLGHYISDRTMILRKGVVVELGPTASVFGNPRHPYTKLLLDSVPQLHTRWNGSGPRVDRAAAHEEASGAALVEVEPGHFVAQR